jgi:sigma-E factor negative regulatory protein RseB
MLNRSLIALMLVSALCSVWPAQASPPAHQAPTAAQELHSWLSRIQEAATRRNFQGTFVVSAGGAVSSARISHYCEGESQFERIDSLDGEVRHVLRHNEVVLTLWPQEHVALIEQRDTLSSFPRLLDGGENRIADIYQMKLQHDERIAGREASVLLLAPRDAYRFKYRLWSDKSSALLLRADVLDEKDNLLESSAFSDVAINVRSQPDVVLQPMRKLEGYRVVHPVFKPTRLENEGWSLRLNVPGFRQVSCVRRPLESGVPGESTGPAIEAVHTIFSDGLTQVSLFIEPFHAQRHKDDPMVSTLGATRTLMRRKGDWWITVVGDVPAATLEAFSDGLERKK